MAKVSVIIPIYNIQAHLAQCLDSLAAQTLSDLECICVDDGSTDSSPAILADYAARDSRFTVLTQENRGPGLARNAGLAAATGEYVSFLDSDDYFAPAFLSEMTARADETQADAVICQAVEFDTATGRELPSDWMLKKQYLPGDVFAPGDIAAYLFQFTYGMAWDKLYRRDWLLSTGILFPDLRNSEDLAFVFPSLLAARRIAILPKVFIHHRVNRAASVSNTRRKQPDAAYRAFELVEAYLTGHGLMPTYRQSFLNWAMEFLVWHVCNISDRDIQDRYLTVIRRDWFPRLNFGAHPASYYRDKKQYAKYLLARYAPRPLFYGVLRAYKQGKGRSLSAGDSMK